MIGLTPRHHTDEKSTYLNDDARVQQLCRIVLQLRRPTLLCRLQTRTDSQQDISAMIVNQLFPHLRKTQT